MTQESAIIPPTKCSPVVRVFGIGGAGVGVLSHLIGDEMPESSLIGIHSDLAALSGLTRVEKIEVQNKARRFTVSREIVGEELGGEEVLARVREFCAGAHVVFIIAGMGGMLGNNLASAIAGIAHEAGAFVWAFAILPFECEGSRRAELAGTGLTKLRTVADLIVCYPNQKSLGLINEGTTLADTFKAANALLAGYVRGAWRAFCTENAIGESFIDLCHAGLSHSKECLFGVAEAAGANRASEAVDRLFSDPILAGTADVEASNSVAVYILGGASLGMAEVNRIMGLVQARCDTSLLLMGAANIATLGETLLLAALFSPSQEATAHSCPTSPNDDNEPVAGGDRENFGIQLLGTGNGEKRNSRFLPPPPSLSPEKMQQLLKQQGRAGRVRKSQPRFRQAQLPLEILSKGRFDKSEPTIHKGEDLDVPTYIRRGVALN